MHLNSCCVKSTQQKLENMKSKLNNTHISYLHTWYKIHHRKLETCGQSDSSITLASQKASISIYLSIYTSCILVTWKSTSTQLIGEPINGQIRPLITKELVEFEKQPVEVRQGYRKITHLFRGIYGNIPQITKEKPTDHDMQPAVGLGNSNQGGFWA